MTSIHTTATLAVIVIAGWSGGSCQERVLDYRIPFYCFQCDEEVDDRCRNAKFEQNLDIYKKCPPLRNENLTMFCRKIEYSYFPKKPRGEVSKDEAIKIIRSCYEGIPDTYLGCESSDEVDFKGLNVCNCDEKGCNDGSSLAVSWLLAGMATAAAVTLSCFG